MKAGACLLYHVPKPDWTYIPEVGTHTEQGEAQVHIFDRNKSNQSDGLKCTNAVRNHEFVVKPIISLEVILGW